MADLILPHGGVSTPVNRTVTKLESVTTTAIPVTDADLSTLYRIGDGGLSPLTGPMVSAEYNQVLEDEVIVRNGKSTPGRSRLRFRLKSRSPRRCKPGRLTR